MKMKKTIAYILKGENYKEPYFRRGLCGDVKTLDEWIKCIFEDKYESVKNYFDGFSDKEICNYIYQNCGKKLEIYKG